MPLLFSNFRMQISFDLASNDKISSVSPLMIIGRVAGRKHQTLPAFCQVSDKLLQQGFSAIYIV